MRMSDIIDMFLISQWVCSTFWWGWGVNIPFIPVIYIDNGGRSMAGLTVSALWLVSSEFYVSVRFRVFQEMLSF